MEFTHRGSGNEITGKRLERGNAKHARFGNRTAPALGQHRTEGLEEFGVIVTVLLAKAVVIENRKATTSVLVSKIFDVEATLLWKRA